MDSASDSLTAAVDQLLEEVVSIAMAPTPPKRKRPEPASQERPNEESAMEEATHHDDEEPPVKKPKLSAPAAAQPPSVAASATAFLPQQLVPLPAMGPAPVVDLEAAVGELMNSQEEHPPAAPAGAQSMTADDSATATATAADLDTSESEGPAAEDSMQESPSPAVMQAEQPDSPALDSTSVSGQLLTDALPATGTAEASESAPASPVSVSVAAAAAASYVAAAFAAVLAQEAAAAAAQTTTAEQHPSASADEAAPTSASPSAHHPLPTTTPTTMPTVPAEPTTEPTEPLPACIAAAAACPSPTLALKNGSHSAPAATTHLPQAETATHIDMLKAGIDFNDTDEGEFSCSMDSIEASSSEDMEVDASPSPHTAAQHQHRAVVPVAVAGALPAGATANDLPQQVAEYCIQGTRLGSGGLGVVYAALHEPTGYEVALKLGGAFVPEQGERDFCWSTFTTEWNTYCSLAGKQLPWLAEPFEFGLLKHGGSISPWITMPLLGPSLHHLNQRKEVAPRLGAYARSMLAALEGLHAEGWCHHDIKPANFMVARDYKQEAGEEMQVYLIDYGFAVRHSPATSGMPFDFVGTPDFASTAVLHSKAPGPRDDLEALGYTLVELTLGELPWDVTKQSSMADSQPSGETGCWTAKQLEGMAAARDYKWRQEVALGSIPSWLVSWVNYCKELAPSACPDYDHLRELIAWGERERQAAAKQQQAGGSGAGWGQKEE